MPISQLGQINTTALQVADVYIQIVPPQFLLNGVPSNILGAVGSAAWGPVNEPVIVGSPQQYEENFGRLVARTFDMGTHAMIAFQQGAHAMKCVRVTDGTDQAAEVAVQTNCITFAAAYTGSRGNDIKVTLAAGSKTGSWQVRVGLSGLIPELFDNIGAGLSGNELWVAIAAAINNGLTGARGPSDLITATAGAGTAAPTAATHSLTGGSDGASGVEAADLLGSDTLPRTGMYALRGQDVSVAILCDVTDATTWASQVAFGSAEGIYMILTGPAGQSISAAKTAKANAGIDTFVVKPMLGDWIYWNDTVNGISRRLVSPQPFIGGLFSNLSPQHSALNKRVHGVVGTEKSQTGLPYTQADLQELAMAGIDVICNPVPGGRYFGARNGRNASSNPAVRGDNYTRMTNYIAATLNRGMGIYVGELQGRSPRDETRRRAKATINAFLTAMQQQRQIDEFQVVLDKTNNPDDRIALGYMQADVKVVYLSVVEFFIINLEGGQTVRIERRETLDRFAA